MAEALYFSRDAEQELVHWLNKKKTVLEVSGARQVGKTTLLKHFGNLYFKNVLYISFAEKTGDKLLQCIAECEEDGYQASLYTNTFYMNIFKRFAEETGGIFTDDENTLIIIDEIQDSKEVYEMVKPFYEYLHCRVIVTGSYLFKAIQFFQPVGCVSQLTLYPLSFLEFIQIYGRRDELEAQFNNPDINKYDEWYREIYEVYCKVGGYPDVIRCYMEEGDFDAVIEKQEEIVNVLINELTARLKDFADESLLRDILEYASGYMITEKRGGELVTKFTAQIFENYDRLTYNEAKVREALSVLLSMGLIGCCDKYNFDNRKIAKKERIYFNDLGILNYYLDGTEYEDSQVKGILAENFVFKTLNEPCRYHKFGTKRPQFGIMNGGELDFTIVSRANHKRYGIEVKSGTNAAKTGVKLLDSEKIDYLVTFKGITNENVVEKKITMPIFLSPLYRYGYKI